MAQDWGYDRTVTGMAEALAQLDTSERILLDRERVVTWHGSPMFVQTKAGGWTRGTPRVLTDFEISQLNPSDVHEAGFSISFRYVKSAPTAD